MSPEISERAFEEPIECALLRHGPDACPGDVTAVRESSLPYGDEAVPSGYRRRRPEDYDRALCLIPAGVIDFLLATQPKEWARLKQHHGDEVKARFLGRCRLSLAGSTRPESPRKAIKRYAAEHDLELARFFVDDAKRFGRLDNDEAGYYRHILRIHGALVLYVGENFSGDATDDLLRPVKQWQAREESKDLAKVTIRGMLTRIEGGYWNGGSPPFGYDLRHESPREDGGAFLFVLLFQPDGSKLVLDESGKVVCTLARGERLQVSKRDRSRLVLSSPERLSSWFAASSR
jgi:hypothetical protein